MKKSHVVAIILILFAVYFLLRYSNSGSSGSRLATSFDLQLRLNNRTKVSRIENSIVEKIPIGTSIDELKDILTENGFFEDHRNYFQEEKAKVNCIFSGGGLLEFTFREYGVTFLFSRKRLLKDIEVSYGITGM